MTIKSPAAFLSFKLGLVVHIIITAASTNIFRPQGAATPLARTPVKSGPFGPSAALAPTPVPFDGRPGQPVLQARVGPGPPAHGACSTPLGALSPPTPAPLPITLAHPAHVPGPHTLQPAAPCVAHSGAECMCGRSRGGTRGGGSCPTDGSCVRGGAREAACAAGGAVGDARRF